MLKHLTVIIYTTLCVILLNPEEGMSQTGQEPQSEAKVTFNLESTEYSISTDANRKLLAYFFHGRKRCMSCRTIEAFAHDALQTFFGELLENGRIEWLERNYANPKFAHFKDKFELYTQSVVLVDMKGEDIIRWKNLKDVWTLTRDKEAYYNFIRREVDSYLKEE